MPLDKFPSDYTIHNLLAENGIDYKQELKNLKQQQQQNDNKTKL
jgi:hypothetical protein